MTMKVEQGSIEALRKMIKDVKYALLTTASGDGTLHSRPLTTLDWAFDGVAWFLVARDSRLATEVSAIPEVNLAYASPEDDTFVSLSGGAQVLQDPARARDLWNPWAQMFFPGGPDSPEVGVLRVDVRSAEYWTGPDDLVDKVTGAARALIEIPRASAATHGSISSGGTRLMTRSDEAVRATAGAAAPALGGHPLGADPVPDGVRFGVWAPRASTVEVVIEGEPERIHPLRAGPSGYHSTVVPGVAAGARYRFRLDGAHAYPDPVSRFQPDGPHGPSLVVDPAAFPWSDEAWRGIALPGQVIYELHIGTFTPEGTFDAAIRELPGLRELGVTLLEVMPVAEFPGRFNWGYDGVALFAPYHGYGDPEAFKRFVDAAHRVGLGVILDVVYNHFGPDGCYLREFSADYFTDRYDNEWGDAINFDGPHAAPVRELIVRNAEYWIREFHLDGLRLDATQSIHDSSRPHVIAELAAAARRTALPRSIVLVAENEPQHAGALAPPEDGGYGLDAMWNDDYHHGARVALTGRQDGYFHDYRGAAQEFVSAARHGYLYQGQHYAWQGKPRGSPALHVPPWSFVVFLQNHDQVANTLAGERLHRLSSPARLRAMTALTLLAPQTPMLFMGEEFAAAQPFPFFADHSERLRTPVREGRRGFLRQFAHYATPGAQATVPDPGAEATFRAAKLDFAQRETNAHVYALYRDLLRLRREDPVIAAQARGGIDGAVLGPRAFLLRWFDRAAGDRLLVVNLGDDLALASAPEPLLAPPRDARWQMAWSSDEPRYGGPGALEPCAGGGWRVAAESATLLVPAPRS